MDGSAGAAARKTNVFISYSRRDAEAADRLHAQLLEQGLNPYLDKHDIAAGEDWKARLGGLIESADTMVFLITPDSIASSVCDWEINHAELLGKRILPVVLREPGDGVPERLQRLNYVFMRTPEEENAAVPRLADALAVDIAWIRAHTRYGELAGEWEKAARPARLLLRGASIGEAERWRDSRPPTAPQMTEAQSAFIAASRRAAISRQRGWLAGSVAVAALAIGLSVYAFFQQQAAEASRVETARVLATSDLRQGTQLVDQPDVAANGIAYLARAAEAGDQRAQTRLWTMLQQRSFWLPATATAAPADDAPAIALDLPDDVLQRFSEVDVNGTLQPTQNIALSGDGTRVFTAVGDVPNEVPVAIRVWNRDGTPITDWWEPPYEGNFYLYRVRGYFNGDGRYLAVELEGWRETSTLVAYDLEQMIQLDAAITASGPLPQTQSIGFSSVRFVERPASDGEEAVTYLVTAAAKGDAAVYRLYGDAFEEVGRNSHRAAITAAEIDTEGQWLMSGATDRTVAVSTLNTYGSVGNLIYADSQPVGLRRSGRAGLLVKGAGGWSAYDLKSPIKTRPVVVPPLETEGGRQEICLRLADPFDEPQTRIEHPSGLALSIEEGRRVGAARDGQPPALAPAAWADVHTVCANAAGTIISITSADFRTEFWTPDFSTRLGPGINERAVFGNGLTPDKTDWVTISEDGSRALVRSSFWNPPNMEIFWISLWDIETGLPLMDRTEFQDDGLTDGVIKSARFTPDGQIAFIGDKALMPQALALSAPPALPTALPTYAEALANQTITDAGLAESVPDRTSRLAEGNRLFDELLK